MKSQFVPSCLCFSTSLFNCCSLEEQPPLSYLFRKRDGEIDLETFLKNGSFSLLLTKIFNRKLQMCHVGPSLSRSQIDEMTAEKVYSTPTTCAELNEVSITHFLRGKSFWFYIHTGKMKLISRKIIEMKKAHKFDDFIWQLTIG